MWLEGWDPPRPHLTSAAMRTWGQEKTRFSGGNSLQSAQWQATCCCSTHMVPWVPAHAISICTANRASRTGWVRQVGVGAPPEQVCASGASRAQLGNVASRGSYCFRNPRRQLSDWGEGCTLLLRWRLLG